MVVRLFSQSFVYPTENFTRACFCLILVVVLCSLRPNLSDYRKMRIIKLLWCTHLLHGEWSCDFLMTPLNSWRLSFIEGVIPEIWWAIGRLTAHKQKFCPCTYLSWVIKKLWRAVVRLISKSLVYLPSRGLGVISSLLVSCVPHDPSHRAEVWLLRISNNQVMKSGGESHQQKLCVPT